MSKRVRKILVVDDEGETRVALHDALSRIGYAVLTAENGRAALDIFQEVKPEIVIADIKMPEIDGLELLKRLKERDPGVPVIIITGYASIDTAVLAMKRGALDYIMKPFTTEIIVDTVARALTEIGVGPQPVRRAGRKDFEKKKSKPVIGRNEQFLKILRQAGAVASSKATVLILGESGTGKEVLARFIHDESNRRTRPFVAINCAALPEGLLESELFGHEKGAFTGAMMTKKGKFEIADGGTVLLDEISEIPLHLQTKLLRVLQEEEVDRLGGKVPLRIDVHVLATTNRDLQEAVKEGKFRQDLYYRLNVIPLRLPALRERRDDIPLLAEYFIKKYALFYKKDVKGISRAALSRFMEYAWPGNIREMENMIERAVLLCESAVLEPWDFWEEAREEERVAQDGKTLPGSSLDNTFRPAMENGVKNLKDVERQMILQALQKTDNNRTYAAKMLGISVRTLRNKLNEYRSKGLID